MRVLLLLGVLLLAGCNSGQRAFLAEVTTNCGDEAKPVSEIFEFQKFDCTAGCNIVSTGQSTSDKPFPLTVMYRSFASGDDYLTYPAIMDDWEGRCDIALEQLGTDVTCPSPSGVGTCQVRIEEVTEGVRD